jgi:regulator of RNase E activity RraA
VSVEIAGVKISEGDWLYADEDGVVVSSKSLGAQA